jgi:hypothetical protein
MSPRRANGGEFRKHQPTARLTGVAIGQFLLIAGLLQVGAIVSLEPSSSSPGRSVRVRSDGWDPSSGPVSLYLTNTEVFDSTARLLKDGLDASSGTVSTDITVPNVEAGNYFVFACQLCSSVDSFPSASAAFEIMPVPVRTFIVDPTVAKPGETLTVQGTGWDPRLGDVSFYSDEAEARDPRAALVTAGVDAVTGGFTGAFPAPDVGDYVLVACQRCDDADEHPIETADLQVVAAAPPTSGSTTPPTTKPPSPEPVTEGDGIPVAVLLVAAAFALVMITTVVLIRRPGHPGSGEQRFEPITGSIAVSVSTDPSTPDHAIRLTPVRGQARVEIRQQEEDT